VSMDTETNRLFIQIDDLVREMTDEEYAEYEARNANAGLVAGAE
jgi:hypothetical protein